MPDPGQRAEPPGPDASRPRADGQTEDDRGQQRAEGGDDRRARGQIPGPGGEQPQHADEQAEAPADEEPGPHAARQQGAHDGGDDQVGEDEQHAGQAHRAGDHDAEGRVEDEVPRPQGAPSLAGAIRIERDVEQGAADRPVERADGGVEAGEGGDVAGRDRQDAAHQELLDVLAPLRGPVDDEDGDRRRHRVHDPDDRLLGDRPPVDAAQGEERGAAHREGQGVPVGRLALDGVPGQHRRRDAERGHLGQREVDEDDPPGQHVEPQVDVDAGEDHTGEERDAEDLEHGRAQRGPVRAAVKRPTLASKRAR